MSDQPRAHIDIHMTAQEMGMLRNAAKAQGLSAHRLMRKLAQATAYDHAHPSDILEKPTLQARRDPSIAAMPIEKCFQILSNYVDALIEAERHAPEGQITSDLDRVVLMLSTLSKSIKRLKRTRARRKATLAGAVALAIDRAGLSRDDVARRVGYANWLVLRQRAACRNFPAGKLQRIAKMCGITHDAIWPLGTRHVRWR